jgi:hypothetical protein
LFKFKLEIFCLKAQVELTSGRRPKKSLYKEFYFSDTPNYGLFPGTFMADARDKVFLSGFLNLKSII